MSTLMPRVVEVEDETGDHLDGIVGAFPPAALAYYRVAQGDVWP